MYVILQKKEQTTLQMGSNILHTMTETKFLGTWIDENLNWVTHFNKLTLKLKRNITLLKYGNVMGWQESVKVQWKDQSVEDFTSKCLFLLFWLILCISLIFLIEIWSFCTNLLENYPLHKIDQLPLFRILSLYMDQHFVITG